MWITSATSKCTSDSETSWVCKGDRVFWSGYVLTKDKFNELMEKGVQFEEVKQQREGAKKLYEQCFEEGDICSAQRDYLREMLDASTVLRFEYLSQRDLSLEEIKQWEAKYNLLRDHAKEMEDRWTPGEMLLLGVATTAVGALLGVGTGFLMAQ